MGKSIVGRKEQTEVAINAFSIEPVFDTLIEGHKKGTDTFKAVSTI